MPPLNNHSRYGAYLPGGMRPIIPPANRQPEAPGPAGSSEPQGFDPIAAMAGNLGFLGARGQAPSPGPAGFLGAVGVQQTPPAPAQPVQPVQPTPSSPPPTRYGTHLPGGGGPLAAPTPAPPASRVAAHPGTITGVIPYQQNPQTGAFEPSAPAPVSPQQLADASRSFLGAGVPQQVVNQMIERSGLGPAAPVPPFPMPTYADTFSSVYGQAPSTVRPLASMGDYRTGGELAASGALAGRAGAINAIHNREVITPDMVQDQMGAFAPGSINNFLGAATDQGRLGVDAARVQAGIANDAGRLQLDRQRYLTEATAVISQLSPNGLARQLLQQNMAGQNPDPQGLASMLQQAQQDSPELFREDPELQQLRGFVQEQLGAGGAGGPAAPVGVNQFNGSHLLGTNPATSGFVPQPGFLGAAPQGSGTEAWPTLTPPGGRPETNTNQSATPQGWRLEPAQIENPETRAREPNPLAGFTSPPGFNARTELRPLIGASNENNAWTWVENDLTRLNQTPAGRQFLQANWARIRPLLARHISPADFDHFIYADRTTRQTTGPQRDPSLGGALMALPRGLAMGARTFFGANRSIDQAVDVIRNLDSSAGEGVQRPVVNNLARNGQWPTSPWGSSSYEMPEGWRQYLGQ
jgi:hypothetical protein